MAGSRNDEPAVSVLVPCYNKQDFIDETLASVYAQTLADYELIVVDDGSTDASLERLRRHEAEGRLRLLAQPNQGVSAARQRALGEARGRYIQYLDADDLLMPRALEARVEALAASHADVAYGDWQKLRRSRRGVYAPGDVVARNIEDVHADAEIACFTNFWCPPAALLYTRAVVERIGPWNPLLPVIQDARYLLDAALAGARFVRVPGVSALYRDDTSDSLSRRSKLGFARDAFTNADEVGAIWAARGELTPAQANALAAAYDFVAREAFRTDLQVFARCIERLRALGKAHPQGWPSIASALHGMLGHRAALAVLRLLGRPAP